MIGRGPCWTVSIARTLGKFLPTQRTVDRKCIEQDDYEHSCSNSAVKEPVHGRYFLMLNGLIPNPTDSDFVWAEALRQAENVVTVWSGVEQNLIRRYFGGRLILYSFSFQVGVNWMLKFPQIEDSYLHGQISVYGRAKICTIVMSTPVR